MKQIIILIVLIMLAPTLAGAHVLKTDGNIGVLMHITPDDDPIIGEPASFNLEIKDKSHEFSAANCLCNAEIMKNGQIIFTTGLYDIASGVLRDQPYFYYTFADAGIYSIRISGKPQNQEFQEFLVQYDVRVQRQAGQDPTTSQGVSAGKLIFGGIAIAVVVLAVVYFLSNRPTNLNI